MAGTGDDAELDDILKQALDDFDEQEAVELARREQEEAAAKAAELTSTAKPIDGTGIDSEMHAAMAKMMSDIKNPEFSATLEATLREMSGDPVPAPDGAVGGPEGSIAKDLMGLGDNPESDKTIAETLAMLAKMADEKEGVDPAATEAMGEEVMKKMMNEFEKMGAKEDFSSAFDGMMRQLLAKEIMYIPMKQITEKFPEWLAENESRLAKDEYDNYGKMYQFFQQIVNVYETEPDNYPRLLELMQDMQECGQPPAEIIKELAPGLEFGPDGMPVLPNMGPGVPGMPPVPNCAIM